MGGEIPPYFERWWQVGGTGKGVLSLYLRQLLYVVNAHNYVTVKHISLKNVWQFFLNKCLLTSAFLRKYGDISEDSVTI